MTVETAAARPRRADACRNRDRLVAAARTVFAARGSEASMEEIARAADVGVGTLYRNFPRRIDLVEAVYRDGIDGLVALADRVLTTEAPFDALAAWLRGFVAYANAKRTFLTELHEAFEKNPGLALTSRERIGAAVGRVLERAQAAGAVRADIDATDLMQLVGGMCMARTGTAEQNERLLCVVLEGLRA
jgi:AcrR family transcriptional regulator